LHHNRKAAPHGFVVSSHSNMHEGILIEWQL
jgi:hypothetical protein